MKTLGICIGASTLKSVVLDCSHAAAVVHSADCTPHEGDAAGALERLLAAAHMRSIERIAVTGRGLKESCGLSALSEAQSIEYTSRFLFPNGTCPSRLISFGAETLLLYHMSPAGTIVSVHSGNKCASGKGAFFLQQIRRMNLDVDTAVALGLKGEPYPLASRCSVFCKSDCTHALNKGEPVENVVAGLCAMMAQSALELLAGHCENTVGLIGGVALNSAVVALIGRSAAGTLVPRYAQVYEALGAALWAADNACAGLGAERPMLHDRSRARSTLPPLNSASDSVRFCASVREEVQSGAEYVLGLDAGSTTTKAVLVNRLTRCIAASVYLRTNGNPVEAARECYRAIRAAEGLINASIIGLGTTGSGRHLCALHGDTTHINDEILAHATAAVHFDPLVDTIFEIGGQDAKYTHLTCGVPSEYAMNEACSAGTGSFLEESAGETLDIAVDKIAGLACAARAPENFSDQCAAFIGSDIKRAVQAGVEREDVLAGLVYSVCMNYLNKVKGGRRTGSRVFMQGGVCYNRAVPLAMAALTHATITVPPDPGLMGALGVALDLIDRLDHNRIAPCRIDLDELIGRGAVREGSFICAGGKEQCDRKCNISKIRVGETVKAFGGMCNRFYNQRLHAEVDTGSLDLVAVREKLLFEQWAQYDPPGSSRGTVGLVRSFMTHQLLPLYSTFFSHLGYKTILSDVKSTAGRSRVLSQFCYPGEISHGSFLDLLERRPDWIFLPLVKHLPVVNSPIQGEACVLVQAEPSYLQSTFRDEIAQSAVGLLTPVLWMQKAYDQALEGFESIGRKLGVSRKKVREAFTAGLVAQRGFEKGVLDCGTKALDGIHQDQSKIAIVLFGRPYNAFAPEADRGIGHKIASRGITVIPCDMLAADSYPGQETMFWGSGQKILKGAQLVSADKQLFGFYISNYSCGPDSFLLGYFGRIMGGKPWLTLELDGHSADAGIDTRIDAALSIIERYRTFPVAGLPAVSTDRPAARVVKTKAGQRIIDSCGREHTITSPQVELLLPSMGRRGTDALAAFFRGAGVNARALPTPDRSVLNAGRRHSTCKECMPYHLTSGSFISYLENGRVADKVSLLFLPNAAGPCRLGQYCEAMSGVVDKERYFDTAVFTLTDEDSYSGLGTRALLKGWEAVLLGDIFGDIDAMLRVCAADRNAAQLVFDSLWDQCLKVIEGTHGERLGEFLPRAARELSAIALKRDPKEVPAISLVGEIFVRREEFSRKNILDWFEQRGFYVKVAPVHEYFYYADHCIARNLGEVKVGPLAQLKRQVSIAVQLRVERRIKKALAASGLYRFEMIDIGQTIAHSSHLLAQEFRGEHHLTVGLGLREILSTSCGVVSIGPFGCMPSRVAEAIMNTECSVDGLARIDKGRRLEKIEGLESGESLPFIAIEADGGEFAQIVEARLEAFALQAQRVFSLMTSAQS